LFKLALLTQLLVIVTNYQAQDSIVLSSENRVMTVESHALYYIDKTSTIGIDDIINTNRNNLGFSKLKNNDANFTGESGTIWISFQVKNKTSKPLFINFENIYIENITIYTVDSLIHKGNSTGFNSVYSSRAFPTNTYLLEIPQSTENKAIHVICSLKSDTQPPMMIHAKVGPLDELMKVNRLNEFLSIAIIGMLVVMLFYNLSLLIVTQDFLYSYYCIYLTTTIICTLWFNGYLFEWFWPNHPAINPYPWPMGLIFIAQLLFVNKMLRISKRVPKIYALSYILYALGISILLSPLLKPVLFTTLTFACAILQPLYFLVIVYYLLPTKDRLVYIFILGWSPLLFITILNAVMTLGIISYKPYFDTPAVEVTLAWEVVIFALALGYRYNLLRLERIKVQEENLSIITDQKITLKKMVLERTEEISAQNEQLIKNQNLIKHQNEKLVTQNKAYEKLRALVLKQNQNLEQAVKKRTVDLANANQELKETLQKLERFSYITAHNLRGPLARILGLCMLLDKSEFSKESTNYEILDKLQVSAKELDIIIHDIGNILTVQTQKAENYEVLHVTSTIYKVLNDFSKDLLTTKFQTDLSTDIETLTIIPQYFESILSNLISNSIKYRNAHSTTKITLRIKRFEEQIIIDYRDNGIGFDSERFKDKLFEPYQKFHPQNEGKGLGLFLVKSLVTAMNGSIYLSSKVNFGVRIKIILPELVSVAKPEVEEVLIKQSHPYNLQYSGQKG
jgi:two-component system, sensor histidine kinase LadS